jgi:DNA primase
VAVEGYMDVIALHQAGFCGAVAPLGTALTEDQLAELWRLSPMPVLCFDGDAAGARAAARAAQLALPHLTPERSLKLATLPSGEDPDSMVRGRGRAAFQAVLEQARPLGEALYDLVREGGGETTPEARAALRGRLEQAAAKIADKALASEYRRVLLDRFFAQARRRGKPGPVSRPPPTRVANDAGAPDAERLRILAAILLRHPGLLPDLEEAWCGLELPGWMARLRGAVLDWAAGTEVLDSHGLIAHLTLFGFEGEVARIWAALPCPLPACARAEAQPAEAELGWWHWFGLVNRHRLEEEVAAASRHFAAFPDGPAERRLVALCAARDALRAEPELDENV